MGNVESATPDRNVINQNAAGRGNSRHSVPNLPVMGDEHWSNTIRPAHNDWENISTNRSWSHSNNINNNRQWVDQENYGDYRNTLPLGLDEKPRGAIGFEVEPDMQISYSDGDTDDDSAYMTVHDAESLMGASAAVFHYLELAEKRHAALRQQEEDSVSISERSAAVFQFLQEAASRNDAEPVIRFLETASVVSQILLEDGESLSGASADIFKFLDRQQSPRQAPSGLIQLWNDAQSVGESVSISDRSAAVFKVLESAKSIDSRSVSEFSAAIFKILDDVQELQSQDSVSVSNQSLAIFQLLDESPLKSPLSSATTLALGNIQRPLYENRSAMPQIKEEHKDEQDTATYTTKSKYTQTAYSQREDYPEVGLRFSEDASVSILSKDGTHPTDATTITKKSILSEEGEEHPIDLVFVEDFDLAFNEFISQHPKFLMQSPDLVHNFRIAKLQKLIEYIDFREKEVLEEISRVKEEKVEMEKDFHLKLREASRKKAAWQINLQSDLQRLAKSTKQMEAKMTWKFVDSCESRSKQQYQMRQKIRAMNPPVSTRMGILQQVPDGDEGKLIRDAINVAGSASRSYSLSVEQEEKMRQYQMDNAFMSSEITVLKKKLAYQQAEARKHAWVESVLLRIDAITMSKLKAKFLKKMGVSEI